MRPSLAHPSVKSIHSILYRSDTKLKIPFRHFHIQSAIFLYFYAFFCEYSTFFLYQLKILSQVKDAAIWIKRKPAKPMNISWTLRAFAVRFIVHLSRRKRQTKIKRGSHKKTERFFRAPPFFMQFFRIRYISLLFRFYRVTT